MDPSKIREKIGRFRILVIGRANAGKTTVLQRVCNTRDQPEIYNSAGEKIDLKISTASRGRGLHNIENEMVFRSNPGFVFHDSQGFEAGGESDFEKVQAFIARRSKETKIANRLHVIWYCIPMDEACRSFTAAENKFFSECDTGSVPVIVLFTKFDALYDAAYIQLKTEGNSPKDARQLAPKCAEETFANGPQLKFLKDVRKPPPFHICLPNMDKDNANSGPLIERTAGALDDETLKQFFVSTQQAILENCMKCAVERTLPGHFASAETTMAEGHQKIIGTLAAWFPHILVPGVSPLDDLIIYRQKLDIDFKNNDELHDHHRVEIQSRLLSVASGSSPLENIVQLISAVVIILEHSFYVFDKLRYLQDQQNPVPSFYVSLEQYIASPHATAVRKAVSVAVQICEEYSSTSKVKPSFGRFQKRKQAIGDSQKMELIETIVEITLEHRLPRP